MYMTGIHVAQGEGVHAGLGSIHKDVAVRERTRGRTGIVGHMRSGHVELERGETDRVTGTIGICSVDIEGDGTVHDIH
jgi:hypothetical protein